MFDKVWRRHIVRDLGGGWSLLHVDRHLLHDLSGPAALSELKERGIPVLSPDLTFATPDHLVSSAPFRRLRGAEAQPADLLVRLAEAEGIRTFGLGSLGQGIVHVMAPELGLSLPGTVIVCGDSHTCTNGGLGAVAFGIGSSQAAQVLASQAIALRRPKEARIWCHGMLPPGCHAKDLILHVIATLGTAYGTGRALEFAGTAIEALSIDERLTVCNLAAELGARTAFIAPDGVTFDYLLNRPFAPSGSDFDAALAYWRAIGTDQGALFDIESEIDCTAVQPAVSWGTNPEQTIPIGALVPNPADAPDPETRQAWAAALDYMALVPDRPIAGTPIDWVFIGSCANGRLSDLREAAAVLKGRHINPRVTAWIVPGSEQVKRDAEREGLDRVFVAAGCEWHESACSMCSAANGERVPPGARAISTSNRNFVGRQGPLARTHLASPAMAAAAAVAGAIIDVRTFR